MNSTHIQIRNVPAAMHRKLKSRAAASDLTITDYVKRLIAIDLAKPSLAELADRVRKLPPIESDVDFAQLVREDRDSR